jgi:hypothetical protein
MTGRVPPQRNLLPDSGGDRGAGDRLDQRPHNGETLTVGYGDAGRSL